MRSFRVLFLCRFYPFASTESMKSEQVCTYNSCDARANNGRKLWERNAVGVRSLSLSLPLPLPLPFCCSLVAWFSTPDWDSRMRVGARCHRGCWRHRSRWTGEFVIKQLDIEAGSFSLQLVLLLADENRMAETVY